MTARQEHKEMYQTYVYDSSVGLLYTQCKATLAVERKLVKEQAVSDSSVLSALQQQHQIYRCPGEKLEKDLF